VQGCTGSDLVLHDLQGELTGLLGPRGLNKARCEEAGRFDDAFGACDGEAAVVNGFHYHKELEKLRHRSSFYRLTRTDTFIN
jgi:hypothetical protein